MNETGLHVQGLRLDVADLLVEGLQIATVIADHLRIDAMPRL